VGMEVAYLVDWNSFAHFGLEKKSNWLDQIFGLLDYWIIGRLKIWILP
jgi:hypothetical protein